MIDLSNIDISTYVDLRTIVTCMCIGKIFKSSTLTKKLNNKYIPYILLMAGILFQIGFSGFSVESISTGIISAAAACGFHQTGKQLFTFNKKERGTNDD